MKRKIFAALFSVLILFSYGTYAQITLQGFYWNYENTNYINGWSNYLADLAPRLRNEARIDAIWIPPSYKNDGPHSTGYSPFDHYDLGDKFQKNNLVTRMGDKDQLLRLIAVMHANGIDVVQDVVLNHASFAGSATGAGGDDPIYTATFGGSVGDAYKNFRYVSSATPSIDETDPQEYYARSGRWPKNAENFHANSHHPFVDNGFWTEDGWGPDFCYGTTDHPDGLNGDNGYGQSSNAISFDPIQNNGYNFQQAREWLLWYTKQTDVDGYRWDAVKHFAPFVMGRISSELSTNNGDWSFFGDFINVGEFFDGNPALLDGFTNDANAAAGADLVGTFDFSLREGFLNMIHQGGAFDIGSLPGLQQNQRSRTATWVENHDTFRPSAFDPVTGDYAEWDPATNSAFEHIHPDDVRKPAAYAISFAMDAGSHNVFFEDLVVMNDLNRNNHLPSTVPFRNYLVNLIWCYQNLNFKDGNYDVKHAAPDNLIIERVGRAIIAATDSWDVAQSHQINVPAFANQTLHDYSGAYGDVQVDGFGNVTIQTPPCNGSVNGVRGYSIWGPVDMMGAPIPGDFNPAPSPTLQEFELADDLGDSHVNSLRQSGALYRGSLRYAGRIYAEAGNNITMNLYKENDEQFLTRLQLRRNGTIVAVQSDKGNSQLVYNPTESGYYEIFVKRSNLSRHEISDVGFKAWVKVNYMAPTEIDPADLLAPPPEFIDDTEDPMTMVKNVIAYPNPYSGTDPIRISVELNVSDVQMSLVLYDKNGNKLATLADGVFEEGLHSFTYQPKRGDSMIVCKLEASGYVNGYNNDKETYTYTLIPKN